jgi:hypothetical protein
MARVFISYRRADGQYAVGWIEERLSQIYQDSRVTMAFRDSDLQLGEDFPDRLANEVKNCDVLIAVIGERWRGDDGDGPARILNPDDWVGREINVAMKDPKTLVIPILLSGVEPLLPSDLAKGQEEFARLHALRFNVRADLKVLVEQVGDHLADIDEERNKESGLDQPLPSTSWRPSPGVVVTAVLAAVAGATISWLLKGAVNSTHSDNLVWRRFAAAQAAYWCAAFVIGRAYITSERADVFHVKWKGTARAAGVALALAVVGVTSYAPGDSGQLFATLVETVVGVLLLSPWILALIGAGWSKMDETRIRDRAIRLAKQRHAMGLATAVLVVALGFVVCTNAALVEPSPGISAAFGIVGFGVFLSALMIVAVEYGHSRMREDSKRISAELAEREEVGDIAEDNMAPALIDGRDDLRPHVVLLLAIPIVVAIFAALIVLNPPLSEASLIGEVIR